jgi:hypothetical protein
MGKNSVNSAQAEFLSLLIRMGIEQGIPAIIQLCKNLSDEPSLEEIRALRKKVLPPEEAFHD